MIFERRSPLTGEVVSRAVAMKASDIPAIAERAQQAFTQWSTLGPNARRAILMKAADALEARQDQFVEAMVGEVGATAGWAMFNVMLAATHIREAAAVTTQICGEVIPSDVPGTIAMALREPVGVLLGIRPGMHRLFLAFAPSLCLLLAVTPLFLKPRKIVRALMN